MAFPTVIGTNGSVVADSSITVVHPAGVVVGDLLVVIGTTDSGAIVETASGWNVIGPSPQVEYSELSALAPRQIVFWKIATGNDPITITGNSRAAYISMLIRGGVSVTGDFAVKGHDKVAYSPPHTPPGGAKDYLWIASFGAGVDQRPAPSGFTDAYYVDSVAIPSGVAYRSLNAATLTPGTWGAGPQYPATSAFTLAVSPESGGTDVTSPSITSNNALSVVAGAALSHALTANEIVTWTKVGGANGAAFTLTGSTLSLPEQSYPSSPLVVIVRATDGANNWSEQTITVSISPPSDAVPPTITSPNSGQTTSGTTFNMALTANEAVTWSIIGGADQAKFTLTSSTLSLPSANAQPGSYVVIIRATDFSNNFTNQTITIIVPTPAGGTFTTPWVTPSSVNGTFAISNSANIHLEDGNPISQNPTAAAYQKFWYQGFGLAAHIPVDAVIKGIEVRYVRRRTVSVASNGQTRLQNNGNQAVGNGPNEPASWTNTFVAIQRGGATDLWGTTWTRNQVVATTFGFQHDVYTQGATSLQVDIAQMRVTYTTTTNSARRVVRYSYWL